MAKRRVILNEDQLPDFGGGNEFVFSQSHPSNISKQTDFYTTPGPDGLGEFTESLLNPANIIGATFLDSDVECANNSSYLIEGKASVEAGGTGVSSTFSIRFLAFGHNIRPAFTTTGASSTNLRYSVPFKINVGFTIIDGVKKMSVYVDYSSYTETGFTLAHRISQSPFFLHTISGTSSFDVLAGLSNGALARCIYVTCKKLR